MTAKSSLSRLQSPATASAAADLVRHDDPGMMPTGGTAGQVIAKNSSVDHDVSWATPSTGGGAPASHAASHATAGSDPIAPADIGALAASARGTSNGVAELVGTVIPRSRYQYANTTQDGTIVLAGDLGGTATLPTVPGLANRELTANRGAPNGYCPLDSAGRIPVDDTPLVLGLVQAIAAATSVTPVATAGSIQDFTVSTSTLAVAVPTGGANRQVLRLGFRATVTSTVTFNSSIRLSTGLSTRAFSLPTGQVLLVALEYSSAITAWVLTAATVSAT